MLGRDDMKQRGCNPALSVENCLIISLMAV